MQGFEILVTVVLVVLLVSQRAVHSNCIGYLDGLDGLMRRANRRIFEDIQVAVCRPLPNQGGLVCVLHGEKIDILVVGQQLPVLLDKLRGSLADIFASLRHNDLILAVNRLR